MPRAGKGSTKAERDALRQEMLVSGCSLELIATEMERRWGIRPREAYRHAHGWSQDEVAARFTEVADRIGGDRNPGPDGRPVPAQAPMIGTRIGEYERWPSGGRRPSPYVLTVLATVLGTTVERLLDYDDHRKMPDQERTVLAAVLAAASAPVVALPPEPRAPPGPVSRPPLGRLTELLTSAGQGVPEQPADGTEEDRAGRAGALTPEQWSAARRLVRRGFGAADDESAESDPETPEAAGDSGPGPVRGTTRARRPRAGGQRKTSRRGGTLGRPFEEHPGNSDTAGDPDTSGTADSVGRTTADEESAAAEQVRVTGQPTAADYVSALEQFSAGRLPGVVEEEGAAGKSDREGQSEVSGPEAAGGTDESGAVESVVSAGAADIIGLASSVRAAGTTGITGATGQAGATDRADADRTDADHVGAAGSAGTTDRTGTVNQVGIVAGTEPAGTTDQSGATDRTRPDQGGTTGDAGTSDQAGSTGPIGITDLVDTARRVGTTDQADTGWRAGAPRQRGRRELDAPDGAVILPFSTEGPEEADPAESGPLRPDGMSQESPDDDYDDPPDQPERDAPPGDSYGPRRLQQRVPRPVPPPLPDPPYIAVTLDPTSPDAAAAARRHRRDQLLATGLHGAGVRSDEEVIMDAAGQSAEFGEWAEGTNVGSTTLEQLDEDVRRISRDYLGNPPLPLLLSALRVRNRVFTLLEGRQHPEQSRHLYLTAGRLCGLLGWMASDVGRHGEAETQARTAWLCAELAGSDGLRAWVRATQSKIAYWDGRIQESAGLASDGLRFAAPDSARVLLASLSARSWARLGHPDQAHSALHVAEDERARAGEDEVGGLLGFSEAQQSYMAGSTYLWLRAPKEALAASDRAVWLFDVGNQSNRFYGAEMLALVDAASALVQSGDLDGAAERLRPILELPPEQQLDTFTSRLGELRDSLRRSRYATSKPAVDIQRQIEEFRAGALGQILGR